MTPRWPRYSEHPTLQRVRIIAAIAGAVMFLTVLAVLSLRAL
jgi:hypothetical protein